jgi:hypothetical protein
MFERFVISMPRAPSPCDLYGFARRDEHGARIVGISQTWSTVWD